MPDTCSLPEDPCQPTRKPPADALGLSSAHICTLTTYRGGSYAHLSPGKGRSHRGGGGPRGEITEFSRASRRRLLRKLNSIDRDNAPLPFFVTLTYHETWPEDARGWKNQLRTLRERLLRRYGKFSAFWRLEFQKRGAPHFHLLLFLDPYEVVPYVGPPKVQRRAAELRLRNNISWAWNEIVDPSNQIHLDAGTRVETPRSWKGVNAYAAKYMGKLETLAVGVQSPGRFWGVWYSDLLPIVPVSTGIALRDFFKVRRVLRRYGRMRSDHRLRALGCFVSYGTTSRLLAAYGYYRN